MEQDPVNGTANPSEGVRVEMPVSLEVLDAKLNLVINKVALLERDGESFYDRLDELRSGQTEIINGQKAILNTLTNEVLDLNKIVKTRVKARSSKAARHLLAFTGGVAGGIAGGMVMTLVLKLTAMSQHPIAIAIRNVLP